MKETFYFKHDYNSRNDERIVRLRFKYPNNEGYAIFFLLLEKLAESSEARIKISDIEIVTFDIRTNYERTKDVIFNSGLFRFNKDFFWSPRLVHDLEERSEKNKKAKLAIKVRWDRERRYKEKQRLDISNDTSLDKKAKINTDVLQGEERRGKERKGNTSTNVDAATKNCWTKSRDFLKQTNCEDNIRYELVKIACPKITDSGLVQYFPKMQAWLADKNIKPEISTKFVIGWLEREGLSPIRNDDFYQRMSAELPFASFANMFGMSLADKYYNN